MHIPKLAIIAGNGSLPLDIYTLYEQLGGEVVLINLIHKNSIANSVELANNKRRTSEELSEFKSIGYTSQYNEIHFSIGQIGKIIDYLNKNNIKDLVIVGSIDRPNLSSLKLDITGSMLLANILKHKILGDDKLLSLIADFIEKKGFNIISPIDILNLSKRKFATKIKPDKSQQDDINVGFEICLEIGRLDIGQAIIIDKGYVLGVEAAEGTDNLIARCARLRKTEYGGILIKTIKPQQDRRLDIPTIGPQTITNLYDYQYSGIAISSDIIILSMEETFNLADQYKIFIHIV